MMLYCCWSSDLDWISNEGSVLCFRVWDWIELNWLDTSIGLSVHENLWKRNGS